MSTAAGPTPRPTREECVRRAGARLAVALRDLAESQRKAAAAQVVDERSAS